MICWESALDDRVGCQRRAAVTDWRSSATSRRRDDSLQVPPHRGRTSAALTDDRSIRRAAQPASGTGPAPSHYESPTHPCSLLVAYRSLRVSIPHQRREATSPKSHQPLSLTRFILFPSLLFFPFPSRLFPPNLAKGFGGALQFPYGGIRAANAFSRILGSRNASHDNILVLYVQCK